MRGIATCGLMAATLCGLLAAEVKAADLFPMTTADPGLAEPDPQFEFGTGWYLRGDVGWGETTREQLFDQVPKLTSNNDWTGDIGAGYRWNQWFRTDVSLGFEGFQHLSAVDTATCVYTDRIQTDVTGTVNTGFFWTPDLGTCTGHHAGSLLKTDVLVGGYVDLGTWYGLTPYVGAGVGFARLDSWTSENYYKTTDGLAYTADLSPANGVPLVWRDSYGNIVHPVNPTTGLPVAFAPQNWSRSTHKTQYNLAWALSGGVAYAVDDHLSLDLGYRYINLGTYKQPSGQTKTIDAQQVRLGIRYAID